nr:MAG TPA: hypothetical protein [Caudoviricetes sp.]
MLLLLLCGDTQLELDLCESKFHSLLFPSSLGFSSSRLLFSHE